MNNQDFQSVRGQLLFNFNPDVSLLLTASVNQDDGIASPNTAWWEVPARYTGGADPIAPGSQCDFGTKASYKERKFCHDARERRIEQVDAVQRHLGLESGLGNGHLGFGLQH